MVLRHPQGQLTLAVSERVFAAADIEFENATEFLGANEQVEVLSLRTCPENVSGSCIPDDRLPSSP
jgi:hypothetical protein